VPAYGVLLPAARTGLLKDGIALCHQVRALSVARLVRRAGDVAADDMRAIDAALLYVLGLEDTA
jgi:mRNA-degrading endonuclease toxin of MazEF toxin-antitoxin module